MGWLENMMGGSGPIDKDEMLAMCDARMAERDYEGAARIAQKYKNKVIESEHLENNKKNECAAYAWYVIAKSVFKSITMDSTKRNYEIYKAFFAAHRMGYSCFQSLLLREDGEWDEESQHYPYFEELDQFYDELYKLYSDDPSLDRADIDANQLKGVV